MSSIAQAAKPRPHVRSYPKISKSICPGLRSKNNKHVKILDFGAKTRKMSKIFFACGAPNKCVHTSKSVLATINMRVHTKTDVLHYLLVLELVTGSWHKRV